MEQGENTEKIVEQEKVCGIVMPISDCDGMPKTHWADVLRIISDSIEDVKFKPNLVSQNDAVVVIHKTIIQNLYQNPIVVCDVSGKNSNVMFELGIRLAFDKPTIIIKDDRTNYSFDTSPIEHLEYPRDLRFNQIVEFKEKLSKKIFSTHEKSIKDPSYSTFLKEFGPFKVAKIGTEEVSQFEFVSDEIRSLRRYIESIQFGDNLNPNILKNKKQLFEFKKSNSYLGVFSFEFLDETKENIDRLDKAFCFYLDESLTSYDKKKTDKSIAYEVWTSFIEFDRISEVFKDLCGKFNVKFMVL